jgi:phage-related minor tail protein
MFTNSVVNQPTLFKFAQGTGLMGEAGPEAIMPLKRDSNGNLGVRSNNQSQKVDVVVNNFGSEKATTKETTDSQGNRKIEVIIGEMVSQQAFSNTFGTRPVLARR